MVTCVLESYFVNVLSLFWFSTGYQLQNCVIRHLDKSAISKLDVCFILILSEKIGSLYFAVIYKLTVGLA